MNILLLSRVCHNHSFKIPPHFSTQDPWHMSWHYWFRSRIGTSTIPRVLGLRCSYLTCEDFLSLDSSRVSGLSFQSHCRWVNFKLVFLFSPWSVIIIRGSKSYVMLHSNRSLSRDALTPVPPPHTHSLDWARSSKTTWTYPRKRAFNWDGNSYLKGSKLWGLTLKGLRGSLDEQPCCMINV